MRLGFIGFGEAASAIAAGLREEGRDLRIAAYDVARGPSLSERAQRSGVVLMDSPAAVAQASDVVLSVVTAQVALAVAREVAPHLKPGAIYADLNSCGPDVKVQIGQVLAEKAPGVHYASVAVMSAVPPLRHRVPMVADGPGALRLQAALQPYGMNIEVLEGPLGTAALLKMCRSVLLKGLEALFLEGLMAAERVGLSERVLASLDASFPGKSLREIGTYLIERHGQHGARRAHELQEAVKTLEHVGVEPLVTRGAWERLSRSAQAGDGRGTGGPAGWKDVLSRLLRGTSRAGDHGA